MKLKRALVIIDDAERGTFYLRLGNGGQPLAFANTLNSALRSIRSVLDGRLLLMAICANHGQKRLRDMRLFLENEIDAALARPVDYRYELEFRPLKAAHIRVVEITEAGNEIVYYRGGTPDAFISIHIRHLRKPRGRTPASYRSRTEYIEAYNERQRKDKAPQFVSSLKSDILNDRAQHQSPNVDLTGVRIYSKEESLDRRRKKKRLDDRS